MEFLKFATKIEQIDRDNSAHLEHQMLLYWLIRGIKPELCVEIGTHRGVTALYMAHALHDNEFGHLHTCDPIDYNQQKNFDSIPELSKHITFYQKRGIDLDVSGVSLVFVDGFHEYQPVLDEIMYYLPRLTKNGLMVFHDCGGDNEQVGVNKAIEESGIEATWIPMSGKLRIYGNFKEYPIWQK